MRYILFANNKQISEHMVNTVKLDEKTDIVILFNSMFPLKYDHIKYFPNKWWIGRMLPIKSALPFRCFAGIDEAKEYERYFTKLIVHSCPSVFNTKTNHKQQFLQSRVDCYDFPPEKISCLEPFSDGTRKIIGYPKGKNMSSGIITYMALRKIMEPEDEIVLVGFTSELSRAFHNDNWEAEFFRYEIDKGRCKGMACYDLEREKYQKIYNELKWNTYLKGNHGATAIDIVKDMNPESIIDIGCGPNLFCKDTIKDLCPCQGLDFAGKWQDIEADICTDLTYVRDNQYDLLTCFDTMEHLLLSCIPKALKEMSRISKRFLMQIDYNKRSSLEVLGSSLHPTVKSKKWWREQLFEYGTDIIEKREFIYGKWKT